MFLKDFDLISHLGLVSMYLFAKRGVFIFQMGIDSRRFFVYVSTRN